MNLNNNNMYIIKTITRADGTTYESAFWTEKQAQEWTEKQELMQRAIDHFGTSS